MLCGCIVEDNNTELLLTVHHDTEGFGQAYVADVLRLTDSGHTIEKFLAEEGSVGRTFATALSRFCSIAGINGKVADAKRGEVLEEMSALRRVDAIVGKCHLSDDACTGDVRPLHRDAKPRIAGTPAARSHEGIATSRC